MARMNEIVSFSIEHLEVDERALLVKVAQRLNSRGAALDQLRADHESLQQEADGMAVINGETSGQLIRLQDAVWLDGDPIVGLSCIYCREDDRHADDCAWWLEDQRRRGNQ